MDKPRQKVTLSITILRRLSQALYFLEQRGADLCRASNKPLSYEMSFHSL